MDGSKGTIPVAILSTSSFSAPDEQDPTTPEVRQNGR
jgi:hypothetical protein